MGGALQREIQSALSFIRPSTISFILIETVQIKAVYYLFKLELDGG